MENVYKIIQGEDFHIKCVYASFEACSMYFGGAKPAAIILRIEEKYGEEVAEVVARVITDWECNPNNFGLNIGLWCAITDNLRKLFSEFGKE
jgi:hypothetical protein